jgi:hypothetical protein
MGDGLTITPGGTPEAGLNPADLEGLEALAERTHEDPRWLDTDAVPERLRAALPTAAAQARRNLDPSRPADIVAALVTLADRHRLDLPDRRALELDAEVMAAWPRDLWRKAYVSVWEHGSWRRMPTVGDFRSVVGDALEQRLSRKRGLRWRRQAKRSFAESRQRYDRLVTLEARLRARARPQSVADCVAALERAGPGVRQTWFQAAMRRNPQLTIGDAADLARWVPVVAARIAAVGLFGRTEPWASVELHTSSVSGRDVVSGGEGEDAEEGCYRYRRQEVASVKVPSMGPGCKPAAMSPSAALQTRLKLGSGVGTLTASPCHNPEPLPAPAGRD